MKDKKKTSEQSKKDANHSIWLISSDDALHLLGRMKALKIDVRAHVQNHMVLMDKEPTKEEYARLFPV